MQVAYLMLILAAAFWGGNYVVGRVLVSHVAPGFIAESRWVIASLFLITVYYRNVKNEFRFLYESFWRTAFLALLGPVLFPTFLYIGEQYTSAVNASMFLAASPAIVLLINALIFRERITLFNVLGVLASTVGVIFVLSQGHVSKILGIHQGKGDLWALGSAIAWGIYCSFLRTKDKRMSIGGFTTITAILGSLMQVPFAVLNVNSNTMHLQSYLSLPVVVGVLFLALGPSLASYMLWSKGVGMIGSTRAEIFTHLIPFFGITFSVIFLKTPLYIYDFIGGGFIISGIVLSSTSVSRIPKTIQKSESTGFLKD
jgi:drug/metabolite transporter (DMT)-like permease